MEGEHESENTPDALALAWDAKCLARLPAADMQQCLRKAAARQWTVDENSVARDRVLGRGTTMMAGGAVKDSGSFWESLLDLGSDTEAEGESRGTMDLSGLFDAETETLLAASGREVATLARGLLEQETQADATVQKEDGAGQDGAADADLWRWSGEAGGIAWLLALSVWGTARVGHDELIRGLETMQCRPRPSGCEWWHVLALVLCDGSVSLDGPGSGLEKVVNDQRVHQPPCLLLTRVRGGAGADVGRTQGPIEPQTCRQLAGTR
eukprot:3033774-Rhodomonas_salina.3